MEKYLIKKSANANTTTQAGRAERAFRPAHGPLRTGPYGPGPVGNSVGPSSENRPDNRPGPVLFLTGPTERTEK